jgi:hypothetical protein
VTLSPTTSVHDRLLKVKDSSKDSAYYTGLECSAAADTNACCCRMLDAPYMHVSEGEGLQQG